MIPELRMYHTEGSVLRRTPKPLRAALSALLKGKGHNTPEITSQMPREQVEALITHIGTMIEETRALQKARGEHPGREEFINSVISLGAPIAIIKDELGFDTDYSDRAPSVARKNSSIDEQLDKIRDRLQATLAAEAA